jgi:hypothetical protein
MFEKMDVFRVCLKTAKFPNGFKLIVLGDQFLAGMSGAVGREEFVKNSPKKMCFFLF